MIRDRLSVAITQLLAEIKMFEAKSIYLGGNIIDSFDCDYNSYKQLGLVCPFCNAPVYLCKGAERVDKRTGKTHSIRSYFSHYYSPNNSPATDCEIRVHTKEGKERIEQLRIESKKQKLRFFNLYLYESIAKTYDFTYQDLNKIRKNFGKDKDLMPWLEQIKIAFFYYCYDDVVSSLYKGIQDLEEQKNNCCENCKLNGYDFREKQVTKNGYVLNKTPEDIKRNIFIVASNQDKASFMIASQLRKYILKYDLSLHLLACEEVLEYLSSINEDTDYSRAFFLKIFKIILSKVLILNDNIESIIKRDYPNDEATDKAINKEIWNIEPHVLIHSFAVLIAGVPWIDIVNEKMKSLDPNYQSA